MSTHETNDALDALTDRQVAELAKQVREMWRQEVAAGKMKLNPNHMRRFDATLKELRQLTGA